MKRLPGNQRYTSVAMSVVAGASPTASTLPVVFHVPMKISKCAIRFFAIESPMLNDGLQLRRANSIQPGMITKHSLRITSPDA
jgi:hypothetical protein